MKNLILLLLIFINITANIIWLKKDTRPPEWDQSTHLNLALDYTQSKLTSTYPPLYHLSLLPALLWSHFSADAAVATNIFYLILILLATYLLAAHLFDRFTGVVAGWFVSTYPFLLYISRNALIETTLTAWVTIAFLSLAKSEDFSSRKWTIIFGLSFAFGMLTKWTFFFFLGLPLLWKIIFSWRKDWKNILIALGIILIIASPWYYLNFSQIIRYCLKYVQPGIAEGDPHGLSWSALTWYFWALEEEIFLPYFVIFILGIFIYFFNSKIRNPQSKILVWWLVPPYLIVSLMSNKDSRYIMPLLPAMAIIAALVINNKNIIRKIFLTGILVVWGSFQFYNSGFGRSEKRLNFLGHPLTLYAGQAPRAENWRQQEIFDYILKHRQRKDPLTVVSVVSNYPTFQSTSFAFYCRSQGLPIYPLGFNGRLGEFAEFIIYKTGDLGPAFSLGPIKKGAEQIQSRPQWFNNSFQKVFAVDLPDGSQGIIFQRKVLPYPLPFSLEKLALHLEKMPFPNFNADNLSLEIIPYSPEESEKGRFREIVLSAPTLNLKGIELNNLKIVFKDVQINLWQFFLEKKLHFFYCQQIHPQFILSASNLEQFLKRKAKWLKEVQVLYLPWEKEGDLKIEVKGILAWKNIPVLVRGKIFLSTDKKELRTKIEKIKVGAFSLPSFLYASSLNRNFSLEPIPEWPVYTKIEKIRGQASLY